MTVHRIVCAAFAVLIVASPLLADRPDPQGPATPEERKASWERHQRMEQESLFRGLPWRCVGPIVQGGRLVDIEVVPGEPYMFYVAYASGGLWRTTNNGVTFEPLFDHQPTIIMGDVALDPSDPQRIWIGTGENNSSRSSYGGAGVFRSDDGGETWRSMGLGETDRIGRISIDPRDSNRVLVAALGKLYTPGGRRGIFLTTDGGKNWQEVQAGDQITGFVDLARDPSDPNVVYAASWERSRRPWNFVEGGPGSGIWKSTDGGEGWTRLDGGFPRGDHVGRIGLAVAPSQPRTVYAVLDNQQLLPEDQWDLGDGAVTAKRLRTMTKEEFLSQDPEEIENFLRGYDLDPTLDAETLLENVRSDEITLQDLLDAIEDANRNLFETDIEGPHVWRSEDGGTTWHKTHDKPIRDMVYTYGYYFGQIRVAPDDSDRIYILGVPLLTSGDGGKTWTNINERNVHVDHHSAWIDPQFPQRVMSGNDGGLNMSFDGGKSWLKLNPNPVGQFYTVAVDMAEPYNIYGGLQDNGVLKGSSRSRPGISSPWQFVGGGDGMYVQIDPRDNKTVYLGFQFGFYFRVDPSGARERARPRNALKEPALRYNWSTPILLSGHNNDILYFGANQLFRSMDKGETWTAISPDLSRSEERGDVPFATITTIAESPKRFGLLWVGTDDGHVHVTDDGGAEWREASGGLPRDRWVTRVEASHHDEETAYVSLNGYRDDDLTVYLYRSENLGESWQDISAGLPSEPVNVIREDPVNPDVLYVGTDRGAYVSLDRGTTWQALPAELPSVPVHDMVVHPRDRELVAGTHGRSVWVLDVLPMQELSEEVRSEPVHVFPLEDQKYQRSWNRRRSTWFYRPESDPYLDIPYWAAAGGKAVLTVRDEDDRVLRELEQEAIPGVNVFRWDLLLDKEQALAAESARLEAKKEEEKDKQAGKKKDRAEQEGEEEAGLPKKADTPWAETVRLERPLYVTSGTYTIRIEAGEASSETELKVKPAEPREPRVKPKPKIRGEKKDEKKDKK